MQADADASAGASSHGPGFELYGEEQSSHQDHQEVLNPEVQFTKGSRPIPRSHRSGRQSTDTVVIPDGTTAGRLYEEHFNRGHDLARMRWLDLEQATTALMKGRRQFRFLPERYKWYCKDIEGCEPGELRWALAPEGELRDGKGYRPRFFDDLGREVDEEGIIQWDTYDKPVYTWRELHQLWADGDSDSGPLRRSSQETIRPSRSSPPETSSPVGRSSQETIRAPSEISQGTTRTPAKRGYRMREKAPKRTSDGTDPLASLEGPASS
jgi:hypothetical protein